MIVCSCNVLTDAAIRAVALDEGGKPRTPFAVQQCCGAKPNCGMCAVTIRAIVRDVCETCHFETPCADECPLGLAPDLMVGNDNDARQFPFEVIVAAE